MTLIDPKYFNSGNGWGLKSEMDQVSSKMTSLTKALKKSDPRQEKIILSQIKKLEEEHGVLQQTAEARIQLYVYEKRSRCEAFKKFWPKYKSLCNKLKEKARL